MIEEAKEFAREAHKHQFRKYNKEPYIEHPLRVAALVRTVPHTMEMLCAAYLHDVVEDTEITHEQIREKFGDQVADLVHDLTDQFVKMKYPHLNRRKRKDKEVERQATISPAAKTIKLADVIDNTRDIVKNDRGFARKYIKEMEALVKVLKEGENFLYQRALLEINSGNQILKEAPNKEMNK